MKPALLILCLILSGCVTYRDFPAAALDRKMNNGTCDVMYYNIGSFNILDVGGYSTLQNVFRDASLCRKMVQVDEKPEKGLFLDVQTKWKPMTIPAFAFGYLSVSTLTLLPVWSTRDGYIVQYNVYVDGQMKDTYRYDITRKGALWLGLLPFAWVNAFTYSEDEAFDATARQFSYDAQSYLKPN
ncbi:hypothetical protein KP001_01600 [Geomonas subterranea]|uniref:Lipoprotein n=1 Tax=Geomonas subterranea TaxID=2847989 RepID=A0ABX8LGW7_9BACT|nr:hypothetical protein [Geomonas subterranea]QXE91263.1 hypothetical protein KP001_01600 [Geomonas subterranea]QXM10650.1 hypothetical protein KP002_05895 [Geomonas subterranea]